MENKTIIYVAGNPNAYPLEYYNPKSQTFEGAVPALFHSFSQNSIYQIEYYHPGIADRRKHFAHNLQVDIVSGYQSGDSLPASVRSFDLTEFVQDGSQTVFQIGFTDTAPQAFVSEFTSYAQSLSSQQLVGMVIDAAQYPTDSLYTPLIFGGLLVAAVIGFSILLTKMRKRKRKIDSLYQQLETDSDTGIGNRRYLERMFYDSISSTNRSLYNVIYFQIGTSPKFSPEEVLDVQKIFRNCACVLKDCISQSDILARISAGGFAVIRCDSNPTSLASWVENTLHSLRHVSAQYDKIVSVTAFAGIYPLQIFSSDLNKILLYSHRCAQAAASQRSDYVVCTKEFLAGFEEEQRLKIDSLVAIQRQEFQIYLQFFVDAHTYKIRGAEALSRWNHPQRGLLAPSHYISMMENEGSISRLDYYNLEKICNLLQRLKKQGIHTFQVSCNFSRNTFGLIDFVPHCIEIIEKYDFPKNLLIFELTESISEITRSQVQQNIAALRKYGVGIALDDLGNGFSSFYDLKDYPVTGIKLPMELIHGIQTENGLHIISAIIRLGHTLGIRVLAEGIETDEHLKLLQNLDCDSMQGFRFYVPMPENEAEKIILREFGQKQE